MYEYIGIDISKATLDVFDGNKSYKFTNNVQGFKKIVKLVRIKEVCLIFEPTGVYAYALINFCNKHQIKAIIVGSKVARDYARSIKQRSKTDKIDAKVLYHYHTQVSISTITIPFLNLQALKITQRRNVYDQYQEMIQRLKNLIEATDKHDRSLIRSLEKEKKVLAKTSQKIFDEIESLLCEVDDNNLHLVHLQTIPGIGKKSALTILLEILRYPHATTKEMSALMGLDPVLKESGTFRGKSRISKQGGKHLREKLYFPTIVAVKHNDRLRCFYERLVGNGKPKKLAIIAAMRKLLVMALAIVRNKEPFMALV